MTRRPLPALSNKIHGCIETKKGWENRQMDVGVWIRGLLGILASYLRKKKKEKKNRIKKRKLRKKKSRGGHAGKKAPEGSIIQKWESCDSETLHLTRCIKVMEERGEAKPDKRAASREEEEGDGMMSWRCDERDWVGKQPSTDPWNNGTILGRAHSHWDNTVWHTSI